MSHKKENRICQNCKGEFIIEPDDFGFYEKIDVPLPKLCPDCRLQRRLAWRNDLTFYNRTCGLCNKKIVSLYHADKPLTVYCNKCWWSDKWNPEIHGQDIDFSRPFFEQFRELQNKVPLLAMFNDDGVGSVNCEYTQNTTFAKNCYMGAMTWYVENIMYYYVIGGPESRDVMDGTDVFSYSQIIYDSIFVEHSYNCRNCYFSSGLTDCIFMYDCKGCSDCFMCVNLRQKKYCILNEQYSKDEYEKIIESYRLDTYSGVERAKKDFNNFLKKQPRRFAHILNSPNSSGNYLIRSKNVKNSIFAIEGENVRFMWRGMWVKDSYDLSPGGKSSLCYEGLTADHDANVIFSIYSLKSQDLSYVENCHSSKDLFGCCAIKHGQYFILNKRYSKKDYFIMRARLIEHMKNTGEYGEFFPSEMSNFGYNETMAQEYFPLTKEQAVAQGFKWWDKIQKTTDQGTMCSEQIPDSIKDVSDSILNEILTCIECGRNYKISQNELIFYKKHLIPIPHKCFYCRNSGRLKLENPFKLWHRKCMKDGCNNEFETSYAPDRSEIIYCERCYQQEVY